MGIFGAIGGGLTSLIGQGDIKSGNQALENAASANLAAWKNIKIPTIEEQQIILQTPDLMGQYTPEQIQYMEQTSSSMENVGADPATIQAQNDALRQLQDLSKGGLSEADKSVSRQVNREVNQQSHARQKAILDSMAQRGTLGSGMELAARLQGEQQSINQASNAGENLTQQAQARALEALGKQGTLSGQMREQQFGEKSNIARAKDAINQFNTQNRQNINQANIQERNRAQTLNLGAQQERENQRAALANQQQMYNKGLIQTQLKNQMEKMKGRSGAQTDMGQAQADTAYSNAAGKKQTADAILGGAFGAFKDGGLVSFPELQNQFKQDTDLNSQSNIPTPMSTPETELDPRYQQAMDESRKRKDMAGLYQSLVGGLRSQQKGAEYTPSYSASEYLKESAQRPLEDYSQLKTQEKEKASAKKAGIESQKDQFELNKMQRDQDLAASLDQPNSSVSQNLANSILTKTKKLGMNLDENQLKGMSANQLKMAFPWAQEDYKIALEQEQHKIDNTLKEKLLAEQIAARKELASKKENTPSFEDKEQTKQDIKENVQIKKENRKERKQLKTDYETWDALEKQIDDAIAKTENYNKGAGPGTGILAKAKTYVGSLAPEAQSLNTSLSKLSMDQLVKQFAGMSKAIDTPAERAAFQATVPDIGQDDKLIMDELVKRKNAARAAKKRIQTGINQYDKTGEFLPQDEQPSRETQSEMVKMRDPKGNIRMIPQNQVDAATKAGGQLIEKPMTKEGPQW